MWIDDGYFDITIQISFCRISCGEIPFEKHVAPNYYQPEQKHCSLRVVTVVKKKLKYALSGLMSSPGASLPAGAEHTKAGDERWI